MRYLLILVMSSQLRAQSIPTLEVSSLNDPRILTTLFDSKKLDSGVVIWKPNFAEAQDFVPSYDGMCYTEIDTIIRYTSLVDTKFALFVFASYTYDEPDLVSSCRMCGPVISLALFTFESSDNTWKLREMKKYLTRHGLYGAISPIGLRKIGRSTYALELTGGDLHQGYEFSWTTLYDLSLFTSTPFEEILHVALHTDNLGVTEDESKYYSWDRTINFVKSRVAGSEYDDIILTKTGRGTKDEDDYEGPIVNLNVRERYHFDTKLSRYVRSK